jgi:sugar/nucleoside kinase (ribokinase family)
MPEIPRPVTAPPALTVFDAVFPGTLFCDVVFSGLPGLPTRGSEIFADSLEVSPGGAATRGVAAARLGAHAALAGVLGEDLFGDAVHRWLAAEPRIDLSLISRSTTIATAVTVALSDGADRTFVTHEDPLSHFTGWPGATPAARTAHVGVSRGIPSWALELRAAGTQLFGGVGWDASGAWSADLLDSLAGVDVFVPNAGEAMAYTRTGDPWAAARVLAEHVPLAVVTCGAEGVVAVDAAGGDEMSVGALPAVPGRPSVDPTGAGDVFTAALMVATRTGWSLRQRLTFATLAAGISVTRPGGAASAPTRAEVDAVARSLLVDGPGPTGSADLDFLLDDATAPGPPGGAR